MSNNSPDDFVVGGLDASPEVAGALGTYFGEFATLEFIVFKLFGLTLGEVGQQIPRSYAALGHVQSIATRLDMLKNAAEKSSLPAETKAAISRHADALRSVNTSRNKYAHGLYETNRATGEVKLTPYATDTRRTSQDSVTITPAELKSELDAMRKLFSDIIAEFFADEMKVS